MHPTSDKTKAALALARMGLKVFRLAANAKGGAGNFIDTTWTATATADKISTIERWCETPGANIGILTDGLCAIDVDTKDGRAGLASLDALKALGPWPETYTQRTPTGGLHFVFSAAGIDIRNSAEKLAAGIDVRGHHGYIVGAGSTIDGAAYAVENAAPIAPLPEWLRDKVLASQERKEAVVASTDEQDTPRLIEWARQMLRDAAPAIQGAGGDNRTIEVANMVMDAGISPDEAARLMAENWNERCAPPWEFSDLERKVLSAARSRENAIGCYNSFAGFEAVPSAVSGKAPPAQAARPLLKSSAEIKRAEVLQFGSNAFVKGLIGPRDVGFLYGDTGTGKTFAAIDLSVHLAHGRDWHGRRIKRQVPVIYACLEGQGGFEKRLEAAKDAHGCPGSYLQMLQVPLSLGSNSSGIEGQNLLLAAAGEAKRKCGPHAGLIIVIDTFSQAIAGEDENSAQFVSAAIRKLTLVAQTLGAGVIIVHHTNKSGEMRGSGAMGMNTDFVIEARRQQDDKQEPIPGRYELFARKVKDDEAMVTLFRYALKQVTIGNDTEGLPVTSCVLDVEKSAASKQDIEVFETIKANWPALSKDRFSPSLNSSETSAAKLLAAVTGNFLSPEQIQQSLKRLEADGLLLIEDAVTETDRKKRARYAPVTSPQATTTNALCNVPGSGCAGFKPGSKPNPAQPENSRKCKQNQSIGRKQKTVPGSMKRRVRQ